MWTGPGLGAALEDAFGSRRDQIRCRNLLLDLSGIFYPNIFDLWLVESVDMNPQMWNPGELAVCPFLVRGSHEPFSLRGCL